MFHLLVVFLSLSQLSPVTFSETIDESKFSLSDISNDDYTNLSKPKTEFLEATNNDDIERNPLESLNIDYLIELKKQRQKQQADRINNNFMRYGKRQIESMPTDQALETFSPDTRFERSNGPEGIRDSRADNFMRFGRSPADFMRFGRASSDFMRFGRAPSNFMRFGRAPADFMRFGRSSNGERVPWDCEKTKSCMRLGRSPSDFLRFGRSPSDFMRFGRSPSSDFMRFGRSPASDFMRFGRSPGSDFMRFGRTPSDFMRFGRNPSSNFMRLGRSRMMRFAKNDKLARSEFDKNFMRFGRPDNFIRFGRASPTKAYDLNFIRFGKRQKNETSQSSDEQNQTDKTLIAVEESTTPFPYNDVAVESEIDPVDVMFWNDLTSDSDNEK